MTQRKGLTRHGLEPSGNTAGAHRLLEKFSIHIIFAFHNPLLSFNFLISFTAINLAVMFKQR